MPLPFIVVEVPAQDRAAPETAVLVEACTTGLAGGRCALTQDRAFESVSAIAIVSWRDREQLNALVEVARVQASTEAWRSEELRFRPEDQRIERFRTLGLAIAALFRGTAPEATAVPAGKGEQGTRPKEQQPPAPQKASSGERSRQVPQPTEASTASPAAAPSGPALPHRGEAWLGAGAVAYYDPELVAWRAGARLTAAFGAQHFPAFASVFGSYAMGRTATGVSLSWSTIGVGPGARVQLSPTLELRGVAHGLFVNVAGQASQAGRTSRQSVWIPGAGLAASLGVRASDALTVNLIGEAQRLAGRVPVTEHNEPAGTVGKTAFGAELQVALRLF